MRLPLSAFWKSPVHAVAGIGNPMFSAVCVLPLLEIIPHPFPDHYDYSPADLSFPDGLPVLMTREKDAVKCKEFVNRHCWAVTVSVEVDEGILEIVIKINLWRSMLMDKKLLEILVCLM